MLLRAFLLEKAFQLLVGCAHTEFCFTWSAHSHVFDCKVVGVSLAHPQSSTEKVSDGGNRARSPCSRASELRVENTYSARGK